MKLSSYFYALIIILMTAVISVAYPDQKQVEVYNEIQSALYNDDFVSAHILSDKLINERPHDLSGHLFQAATYLAEMSYEEDNLFQDQFLKCINTIENLFKLNIQTTDSSYLAWQYLWRGHARAYLSLWESKFGSVTSALKQGLAARNDYQKGLEYDSSCYDLYGGLGMYHYWKSVKAGFLTTLGIFNDDAQRGIDELYLTIDSSLISKTTARNALTWIYFDKKQYDSVITISEKLIAMFPNGSIFYWPYARAYYESEQYDAASKVYEALRRMISSDSSNYYNLIECDYQLIKCYNKLNDRQKRQATVERFKKYYKKIGLQTKNRQHSKIAFIKRYF